MNHARLGRHNHHADSDVLPWSLHLELRQLDLRFKVANDDPVHVRSKTNQITQADFLTISVLHGSDLPKFSRRGLVSRPDHSRDLGYRLIEPQAAKSLKRHSLTVSLGNA